MSNQSDDGEEEFIEFMQWTSTDRAELLMFKLPISEFISTLTQKLDKLTAHSFTAKAQAKFLNKCKADLTQDEVVILGDFAENYKFVIQDEIQSYHWNQQSCSLHPVVVYYLKDGVHTEESLCLISDDLTHDVQFVYKVISSTLSHIKDVMKLNIKKVHYFSDGCAAPIQEL